MFAKSAVVIFFSALVGTAVAVPQVTPAPAATPLAISPLQCTTPPIQCCSEIGPVSYPAGLIVNGRVVFTVFIQLELLGGILYPILSALGISGIPLSTIVATGCSVNVSLELNTCILKLLMHAYNLL